MTTTDNDTSTKISSTVYIAAAAETIITFCLATFCLGLFFTHQGISDVISSVIIVALYLFIIVVSTKRLIDRSSIAAIMLMIPIAPLFVLIIVVSLLHLLQLLK